MNKLQKKIVAWMIRRPILFLIWDEFIDFSESIWIFKIFIWIKKKNIWKFWKINVTLQISDMFLYQDIHIKHNNLSGDWTNSCMLIASIFFNGIFINLKKFENLKKFWKIYKFIWNEEKGNSIIS